MKPILLLLLLGGGAAAALASSSSKASTPAPNPLPPATGSTSEPPDIVLQAVAQALSTSDPAYMRSVAAQLRQQGWTTQAASLEEAANIVEIAQATGATMPPAQPPQPAPSIPVPSVPGVPPVTSPGWQSVPVTPAPSLPLPSLPLPSLPLPSLPLPLPSLPVPSVPPVAAPASPSVPVPIAPRILTLNMIGVDVAAWQTVLKNDGYALGTTGPNKDGVDGKFGTLTLAATARWQREHGLTPDGKVGPLTLAKIGTPKLVTSSSSAPVLSIKPSTWPTLKLGTSGQAVKEWQSVLIRDGYSVGSAGVDGIFGTATATATKAWQAAHGLVADGVVGGGTRAKIGNVSTMSGDMMASPLELRSSSPLPGIVPLMAPTPSVDPRRALAARTAAMLFNSQDRVGTEDRDLVRRFQEAENVKATGMYGPSTALAFVKYGLVPPRPFYWTKQGAKRAKHNYRTVLLARAAADPQRSDEWAVAAMV